MKPEEISRKFNMLHINVSQGQQLQLVTYYQMVIEKNKVMNLTAIEAPDEFLDKHFVDSLSINQILDLNEVERIIDIGTGAGFPGIPLKIVFPHLQVTLLDSLGKRVKFLNEVIDRLGLENIEAIHGRAEDLAKKEGYRESFDLCVSRAVANLSTLSEYCLPFVKIGGCFMAYKSGHIEDELKASAKAIQVLGGAKAKVSQLTLPETDYDRSFVQIHKIKETNRKYPRKAGLPSKEPIS